MNKNQTLFFQNLFMQSQSFKNCFFNTRCILTSWSNSPFWKSLKANSLCRKIIYYSEILILRSAWPERPIFRSLNDLRAPVASERNRRYELMRISTCAFSQFAVWRFRSNYINASALWLLNMWRILGWDRLRSVVFDCGTDSILFCVETVGVLCNRR